MVQAKAVLFQIVADILALEGGVFAYTDVGDVGKGCAFNVCEDRIEIVGIDCEPDRVGGRQGFAAKCAHKIGSPTEDDHLWDCFRDSGFMLQKGSGVILFRQAIADNTL